jgi:hypothetical protein
VNGADSPKKPGHDGGETNQPRPKPDADTETAPNAASDSSKARATNVAPDGAVPPDTTARDPDKDELTAIKEEKLECGAKARRPSPAAGFRNEARVIGFASQAETLAMIRSSQMVADRHINPQYLGKQHVFAETLDGAAKFTVALPPGLTVNVGDVIDVDQGHIDPSNPCQYIPNVALGKP